MDLAEHKRMTMMSKGKDAKNLIVGLDIGTSKIVAIVAEVMPDGTFQGVVLLTRMGNPGDDGAPHRNALWLRGMGDADLRGYPRVQPWPR